MCIRNPLLLSFPHFFTLSLVRGNAENASKKMKKKKKKGKRSKKMQQLKI